ncbi:hypothetical protein R1sor_002345 [Riccia sorocarpa]|uniref:Uncharacterized protein n=1 Tax=Riccia sorocarpa TaxID=122646 RepID=A0ABD3GZE6_9MARC
MANIEFGFTFRNQDRKFRKTTNLAKQQIFEEKRQDFKEDAATVNGNSILTQERDITEVRIVYKEELGKVAQTPKGKERHSDLSQFSHNICSERTFRDDTRSIPSGALQMYPAAIPVELNGNIPEFIPPITEVNRDIRESHIPSSQRKKE